jgi:MFS family permease
MPAEPAARLLAEPAAQPLVEPSDIPLAQNRDFKVLLVSQGISSLGDAVSFTALPLLVLALTGSGFAMGIVGALQAVPALLFGMVAGAYADRGDRKRMMFVADLGRAALTALIPLSVALGGPTMTVILVVAAPMAILRSFFLAGYTASVPALVGRSQVGRANSIFEVIYSTGYILGPAIAGVLATTIGPGPTMAIDAVSFALSALGLIFVRRDLRAPVDRPRQPLLTEIREGIDFIVRNPILRTSILFWGVISILLAPLVTALAVHVTRDLDEPASVLGLILASYGVGTLLGSVLTARWIGRGRVAEMLLGGNFVMGIALIALAVTVELPVQLAVAFVAGIVQSVVLVVYLTLRTVHSPDELLGRVGSTARTISLGLQPVGLLIGGALIDLTSGSITMALMGVAVAAVSLLFAPIAAIRNATLIPE